MPQFFLGDFKRPSINLGGLLLLVFSLWNIMVAWRCIMKKAIYKEWWFWLASGLVIVLILLCFTMLSPPTKEDAIILDDKVQEIIKNSESANKSFIELASTSNNELELYDLAKSEDSRQNKHYKELADLEPNKYVDAAQDYVLTSEIIAEKIMKYLDKKEPKYLSDANDNMKELDSLQSDIETARTEYLKSVGLTDGEINKMR